MGERTKNRNAIRSIARLRSRRVLGRLALVLLLALAPAFNLAAPVTPRDSIPGAGSLQDMARADPAAAPSESCTHANIAVSNDNAACGDGDNGDASHHADPLCVQCIAFGSPGLPGAPDIAPDVALTAAASAYPGTPNSHPASHGEAACFCRGPPHAV